MPSAFARASFSCASIKGPDGFLQTQPFLDVCRQVLPVVEKLGTAFTLVKTDIGGNIEVGAAMFKHLPVALPTMRLPMSQRLSLRAAKDPDRYTRLFSIVADEVVEKAQNDSTSCTKGLLWLKR
ncbi:Pleckstrin y domain-containing family A member 8 [Tetrabaena socialis]|uniref:Pleckstrin y domain-containing family A member 8 n=1 Tax=Tetrabaena socialis TaxID=47790 RepID=A0A2J7ZV34_9CHLO|nr:Pleckstrin y domain-containing family A member 8 [Tetrabaena socialis]|eukprot:PNH04133.1 Pleckstrin y domain-containing family A member 8 [Tetrabaena socialis]